MTLLPTRGKEKKGENSTSKYNGKENNFSYENPESSSKEKENSNDEDNHAKMMNELKKCLKAIINQSNLREVKVIIPHPVELDAAPYPFRFKAPTLQAFDGKGLPNQHIYYYKSQTENAVSNDAILARLFIGTLKGVSFEWFTRLFTGSIKK